MMLNGRFDIAVGAGVAREVIMASARTEDQPATVTMPRKPVEQFLEHMISQLRRLAADIDGDDLRASVGAMIRECRDSLELVRTPDDPLIEERLQEVLHHLETGELPPAVSPEELDAKFAAYLG